ncbi:unnamed protein product [Protopolystoma xenopodis]|uniref:Uncharacterized protein n=1 Tax=Protopolystoma xenopodis TaxID=117903 RepID=A0A3S5CP86_9PLAT|nr:unnamed protein product [Protopolystoma xenopodis]
MLKHGLINCYANYFKEGSVIANVSLVFSTAQLSFNVDTDNADQISQAVISAINSTLMTGEFNTTLHFDPVKSPFHTSGIDSLKKLHS